VGAPERLNGIERVQEVPAGLLGDPPREHRHRGWHALRCESTLEILQHVVTAWRRISKQVHTLGAIPQPASRPVIGPGSDQQMRILDFPKHSWQRLRGFRGKALVQRVDQEHDPGYLTRLAHPLEGQRHAPLERRLPSVLRFEPAQINADPSRRPARRNIAGVNLDIPHVNLGQQGGLPRVRKPRDRLGQLVRQPLGNVEQVDLPRAAEVGSGNRHGPRWRSHRGCGGEPTSRRQGKVCRDRGLAGARLAEQEKHPCWPAEELVKAREHPASAGEMRRPLLGVGPVKFRELHQTVKSGPLRSFRSGPRRSPRHHRPHRPRALGPCGWRLGPEAWPGRRAPRPPHRPLAVSPRRRQRRPRFGAAPPGT